MNRSIVEKLLEDKHLVSDFTFSPTELYIPSPGYVISVTSIDEWDEEVDQLIATINAETLEVQDFSEWPIENITSLRVYKQEAEYTFANS